MLTRGAAPDARAGIDGQGRRLIAIARVCAAHEPSQALQAHLDGRTLSIAGHPGANTVLVQGRVSRARKLRPGQYTLTVVAANGAGSSRPQSLRFTIVP